VLSRETAAAYSHRREPVVEYYKTGSRETAAEITRDIHPQIGIDDRIQYHEP